MAMQKLGGEQRLEIVPGASHLFEEPGALEQVAHLARDWFAAVVLGLGALMVAIWRARSPGRTVPAVP